MCRGHRSAWWRRAIPAATAARAQGELVKCPWHGWMFDVRTGQSWCDPGRVFVRRFDVSVEPGEALVQGPFVAETYPVEVEDEYVVVRA